MKVKQQIPKLWVLLPIALYKETSFKTCYLLSRFCLTGLSICYFTLLSGLGTKVLARQPTQYTENQQITNVRDLQDVRPTDWAYSALQNLIERYGFPQGYEDGTFRGDRSLSRYEFAAALNALLTKVELDRRSFPQEDFETLSRLQRDFASELETIASKIDRLDKRVSVLEDEQFSTTTKLSGQVIFATTAAFRDDKAIPAGESTEDSEEIDNNFTFSNRIRLFLNTSFTGQDLLRVRLLAGNVQNLSSATGTNMTRLSFDNDTDNQLEVDQLFYQFPVADEIEITLLSVGTIFDVVDVANPLLGSDATGSPFLFGVRSPIYRENIGGTGAGISYDISSQFNLSAVYLAEDAASPEDGSGLFDGEFTALGQFTWKPTDSGQIALAYSRSYNAVDINAGGQNTNAPFGDSSDSISADSFGFITNWQINSQIFLGGWAGWVRAVAQDLEDKPTAEILYYAATFAVTDFAKEGDLTGVVFGQPPKLIENEFAGIEDPDPALNLELFYRFPASDRISVTPGFLVIFNPEHNDSNDTIYMGTVRTTFSF